MPELDCYCVEGWICEEHTARGWPHDGDDGQECAGPGMPCKNADCPWWKGTRPAALHPPDWTSVIRADGETPDSQTH